MRPELRVADELGREDAAEQTGDADEVEDQFCAVGADVPAFQRAQIRDAVDAAGVALLADDQDGQDRGDRLRDDREVDAADAPLEHRGSDDEGEESRHQHDHQDRQRQAVERLPEERNLGDLIPVHEVRDAGRRLDLRVCHAGRLELQVHRHAVAAEAEEHSLPEAQDAAETPAQHKAHRDEGVGEIFADQVEAEHIERQRQHHDQQQRQHRDAEPIRAIEEACVVHHGFRSSFTCGPSGRTILAAAASGFRRSPAASALSPSSRT